jgi:hypothetical protein
MRNRKTLLALGLILTVCGLAGCDVTLGPKTKTEYVLVHTGRPLEVLENANVKGRVLDGSGAAVQQDVGGWVMMPPDHWDAVKKQLEK